MNRQIVYEGAIPRAKDQLLQNVNAMTAIGMAMQAILGAGTWVDGLACSPQTVPNLTVLVAAGSIYSLQNLDSTAYGSVAADTTHQIVKQGIVLDPTTLACPAPSTSGFSINYLVQVAYQDVDSGATVLPYYNSSNPAIAYNGPNGTGVSQSTVRQGVCVVQVKAGVAAATGTQTTPSPDAGFTGLFSVTVANGQTTITSPNIAQLAGAPFINPKLTNLGSLALNNHGQCRLTKYGTSLLLSPRDGNRLVINGTVQTIPSAGISLPASGLSANTLYYIYAYMNSGTMTLEASATTHAKDSATGVEIKSGDATRTLVGMALTTSGAAFADTASQRFVISYFNRRQISLSGSPTTGSTSATGSTLVEISSGARTEGISWGDEAITGAMSGYSSVSVVGGAYACVGYNANVQMVTAQGTTFTATSQIHNASTSGTINVSEGYFNITGLGGNVTGGGSASYTYQITGTLRG